MPGPTPPGHGGLTGRLAEQDRRIEQLTQRSPQAPACVVRLNVNVGVDAGVDVRPVTSWKPTAETDSTGMYHYNEGGDSWWQLPNGGRWSVLVQTHWTAFGNFDPTRPPVVSTSLLLNSTGNHSPGDFGIAEATAFNFTQNTAYPLICEDRVFRTNDQIRVNFWSQYGGTVASQQLQTFTHVVFRYLGPN